VLHPVSRTAKQAAKDQREAAIAAPAVKEKELTATEWFERGFNAADLDEQIRCYSEAIRLNPDYGRAFNNRGTARQGKGDLEGALQDYDEAIRLLPDYQRGLYNRGTARQGKGDLEGALQDYDEAIRLTPDDADAFYGRGNVRQEKGNLEGA